MDQEPKPVTAWALSSNSNMLREPLYQFLLVRWYYRMFIWTHFLWRVSRVELSLIPTHPDLVGGLGFLANTVYAFVSLALTMMPFEELLKK
jgi:hypothetical protein